MGRGLADGSGRFGQNHLPVRSPARTVRFSRTSPRQLRPPWRYQR